MKFRILCQILLIASCAGDDGSGGQSESDPSSGATASSQSTTTGEDSSGGPGDSTTPSEESTAEASTAPATGGVTSDGPASTDSSGDGSTDSEGSTEGSSDSTGIAASEECVQYCDEFLPNCNEVPGIQAYDDLTDCLTTCNGFDHTGIDGVFTGNTVQCRIAHLTFDPNPGPGYYELHCFHAQEDPMSQCL